MLPVNPPLAPMLAKSVGHIPPPDSVDGGLAYEPKWDGFRCLAFRDGEEVYLGSRNERPLNRYFPEVVEAVKTRLPERCVVDGELFVAVGERLEFERLLERIHPAESRVRKLAAETPASYVVFDLLALDDEAYLDSPFERRREALGGAMSRADGPVYLTPMTRDMAEAQEWFARFEGAGLDGVVAKPLASPYTPGARTMLKVKHLRTADVVLAGYRLHKTSTQSRPLLGSMLLGLYDDSGTLQHVGVCGSFSAARRAELLEQLRPLEIPMEQHPWGSWAGSETDRRPGGETRWNAGKDLSWVPLDPRLVLEVSYDHMEGTRFRHTTQFQRWRPDRDAESCTYEQLEEPVSYDLDAVLSGDPTRT